MLFQLQQLSHNLSGVSELIIRPFSIPSGKSAKSAAAAQNFYLGNDWTLFYKTSVMGAIKHLILDSWRILAIMYKQSEVNTFITKRFKQTTRTSGFMNGLKTLYKGCLVRKWY